MADKKGIAEDFGRRFWRDNPSLMSVIWTFPFGGGGVLC
jgi:hypothetical protein